MLCERWTSPPPTWWPPPCPYWTCPPSMWRWIGKCLKMSSVDLAWQIRVRTCAMWNMNFSNTYMMTTSMSLLNLSTCSMEMTLYNYKIAFIEFSSKNCTINMCNMSDWFPLNGGLEISTFAIYYQWTILAEFCFKKPILNPPDIYFRYLQLP